MRNILESCFSVCMFIKRVAREFGYGQGIDIWTSRYRWPRVDMSVSRTKPNASTLINACPPSFTRHVHHTISCLFGLRLQLFVGDVTILCLSTLYGLIVNS